MVAVAGPARVPGLVPAARAAGRPLRRAVDPHAARSEGRALGAALAHRLRLVARLAQAAQDLAGVLAAARLEHELDAGLADMEVDALAQVLDVDEVRPGLADER